MLRALTVIVNFVGVVGALWLGLYVVSRSPRSPVAWLTGLTFWSASGLFLNILLALHPPPAFAQVPGLLQPIENSSSPQAFATPNAWLEGWLVAPAIMFWHHATMLMRPGRMNAWRGTRVTAGYLVALAAIVVQVQTNLLLTAEPDADPLFMDTLREGPLYPVFMLLLLVFTGMSIVNLARSGRSALAPLPRMQFFTLASATAVAGLVAPIALLSSSLGLRIPRVVISTLLVLAVGLIGIGVARYSALSQGRTLRKDMAFNALAVASVAAIYVLVSWFSVRYFGVPAGVFLFLILLAVVTHSLVDHARYALDAIVYGKETRAMRGRLRQLADLIGARDYPQEFVESALRELGSSIQATSGSVFLFDDEDARLFGSYNLSSPPDTIADGKLRVDDVRHLEHGTLPGPLNTAALLIPLYAEGEQIGALVLGPPANAMRYSTSDVDRLLYPSDAIAEAIADARREQEVLAQAAKVLEQESGGPGMDDSVAAVRDVETALRGLWDFAALGDHPLARTQLVRDRVGQASATHVDLGKAVHELIIDAIERLRPAGEAEREPPPREWHAYRILHDAYIKDVPNRDIMNRLYISEGSFNRARRGAVRAISRMLQELEAASVDS